MSFFRDLADQSRQAFLSMPMQSRVIAVLLVVAISVSFGFLVRGSSKVETAFLFGDQLLSESQLVGAELEFGNAGLAGFKREGRRILVPAETRSEFLSALKDSASLPSGLQSHVEQALASTSPFESSQMQKERIMLGKQQQAAKNLENFIDIRHAEVTYTEGERWSFRQTRDQSASVMITPEGSAPLPYPRRRAVQQYVANSFGMPFENVNVTDVNASGYLAISDDEDPLLRRQREVEERTKQQILSQLRYIEGVNVEVRAKIDPTLDTEEVTKTVDAQPTTIELNQRKISENSTKPRVGGVPGTVPNAIGNRAVSIEDTAQTSTRTDDTKTTKAVAGEKFSRSRIAGLLPTKVTATIVVPTSYYKKAWIQQQQQQDPSFDVADLSGFDVTALGDQRLNTEKMIQDLVGPLLSEVAAGADPRPSVIVRDLPDLYQPAPVESKTAERAMTWLADSWQKIAMVVLGLFALMVARSAVRGGNGGNTPAEFQEGFGLELPAPPPPLAAEDQDKEKMTITGQSLKEDLVDLVEANPEVAANVIRGWVGEAA